MSLVPNEDVLFHSFGGEAVLLDQKAETYYRLNETALRMWELVTGGASEDDVVATVASEFDAPTEHIARDYTSFVEELISRNIVTVAGEDD